MALREYAQSPEDILASKVKATGKILVLLVADPKQGPILIPDIAEARRVRWENAGVEFAKIEKRFGAKRLLRGTVIAAGRELRFDVKVGQTLFVHEGRHCLKVMPNDPDSELGPFVPKGSTLCFYGMVEPWDTFVEGIDA